MPDRFKPGTRRAKLGLYLGRRGAILVLFGFAYMMIGFGFATTLMDRFSRPGPGGPLEFMDTTPFPGIFWIICGAVALANGIVRRRWHNEDALGYAALTMPPTLWTAAYLWSFISWVYSQLAHWPEEYGRQTGYIGAGAYGMIAIILVIIAHWHDDLDVRSTEQPSPAEKALLDAMIEAHDEVRERGNRARRVSEKLISQLRRDQEALDADEAKQRRDDS